MKPDDDVVKKSEIPASDEPIVATRMTDSVACGAGIIDWRMSLTGEPVATSPGHALGFDRMRNPALLR
jgi:hypothetical protein